MAGSCEQSNETSGSTEGGKSYLLAMRLPDPQSILLHAEYCIYLCENSCGRCTIKVEWRI